MLGPRAKVVVVTAGALALVLAALFGRPAQLEREISTRAALLDADVCAAAATYLPLFGEGALRGTSRQLAEQAQERLKRLLSRDGAEVRLRLAALAALEGDLGAARSYLSDFHSAAKPPWLEPLRKALAPNASSAAQLAAARILRDSEPRWAASALRRLLFASAGESELARAEQAAARRQGAVALLRLGVVFGVAGAALLLGPLLLLGYLVWLSAQAAASRQPDWQDPLPEHLPEAQPPRAPFPWTVLDGLAGAGLMLVVSATASAFWSALFGGEKGGLPVVLGMAFSYLCAAFAVCATVLFAPVWPAVEAARALGLRAVGRARAVFWGAGGLVAIYPIVAGIGVVMSRLFPNDGVSTNPVMAVILGAKSPVEVIILFLLVGLVAPVFEELLFRGCVYGALRTRMSAGWAAVLSAVLFSLLHMDWFMVPQLVVIGVMLAHLRERTGSLFPAMVAHGLLNGGQLAVIVLLKGL